MAMNFWHDESWNHLRWGIKVAAVAIALTVAMLLGQDMLPATTVAQSAPPAARASGAAVHSVTLLANTPLDRQAKRK
jgi:hypothetical protein